MPRYARLPRPDDFGNYWLGEHSAKGGRADPAVFPSKRVVDGVIIKNGGWVVFLGSEQGFIFNGEHLASFRNTLEALDAINERVA